MLLNSVLLNLFSVTIALLPECKQEFRKLAYYKVKSCHKSPLSGLFQRNVDSLKGCKVLARERGGLAFNFSPPEVNQSPNCLILSCPETGNFSTLVPHPSYDYYSAYASQNLTENATCVKSLGLFRLTPSYLNYTETILNCQNLSGDLADVTSEYRTVKLAQFINTSMPNDWYKAVFVGLDDLEVEGVFRNSYGKPLTCSRYRAWAPGHPRAKHETEDCVTLDSGGVWRVAKCDKTKLRGLCEILPHPPDFSEKNRKNVTCRRNFRTNKASVNQKITGL